MQDVRYMKHFRMQYLCPAHANFYPTFTIFTRLVDGHFDINNL